MVHGSGAQSQTHPGVQAPRSFLGHGPWATPYEAWTGNYWALVSEIGKIEFGMLGVCKSMFKDNCKKRESPKAQWSYSYPEISFRTFPKTMNVINITTLGFGDMFNPYPQPFKASLSKFDSAAGFLISILRYCNTKKVQTHIWELGFSKTPDPKAEPHFLNKCQPAFDTACFLFFWDVGQLNVERSLEILGRILKAFQQISVFINQEIKPVIGK